MSWNNEAYRQILRRKCRDSFWHFLLYGFGAYYNPKGKRWLDESIHKPLCDWFQSHIDAWIEGRRHGLGYPLHLMVLVPRDVGKTTVITQAGMAWIHLRDPEISTYIGSERADFAIDMLGPIKNILSGEDTHSRFAWLYGNWCDPQREWKQQQVVHAARTNMSRKEPSFGIWGVESGITGKHPDVLCLDDPISYEKLAAAGNWLTTVNNHIDSLVPVLPSDGCLIFVGTRYHDGDHFGVGLRKEFALTVSGMSLPSVSPREDGKWHCYFLAGRDSAGQPAIPRIWPERRLKDFHRRNPLRYSAQVLNDPMNTENAPITHEHIEKATVPLDQIPKNLRITFHLDTAFKTQESLARGDFSVITAMGHSQDGTGNVYHLGSWGSNMWTGEAFGTQLMFQFQHHKSKYRRISMITDEQVIGGKAGTWELLLRNWFHDAGQIMPPFVLMPRNKKKVIRHIEAANFIVDGHAFLVANAPGHEELVHELLRIGGSLHDDYIDTFADCFSEKCYNVMHRNGAAATENDQTEDPWDTYIRTGKGNIEELLNRDYERLDLNPYPPI